MNEYLYLVPLNASRPARGSGLGSIPKKFNVKGAGISGFDKPKIKKRSGFDDIYGGKKEEDERSPWRSVFGVVTSGAILAAMGYGVYKNKDFIGSKFSQAFPSPEPVIYEPKKPLGMPDPGAIPYKFEF